MKRLTGGEISEDDYLKLIVRIDQLGIETPPLMPIPTYVPGDQTRAAATLPQGSPLIRPEPGEVIGKYRLVSMRRGGMGEVWQAEDTKNDHHPVALKFLPAAWQASDEEIARIKRSYNLVRRLIHSNICMVRDLDEHPRWGWYQVLDWVEGKTFSTFLHEHLEQGVVVSVDEALPLLRQAAHAVDFAHQSGVLHRDIKPGNLMVNEIGQVFVIDFGLAAEVPGSVTRLNQPSGDGAGTVPYLAPEIWEGAPSSEQSDRYAFAVTTYELLSGRRPFDNLSIAVLSQLVLTRSPPEVPHLSAACNVVLGRALAKNPNERFASCFAFVEALDVAVQQPPKAIENLIPIADITPAPPKAITLEDYVLAAVVALVLIGAALGLGQSLWTWINPAARAESAISSPTDLSESDSVGALEVDVSPRASEPAVEPRLTDSPEKSRSALETPGSAASASSVTPGSSSNQTGESGTLPNTQIPPPPGQTVPVNPDGNSTSTKAPVQPPPLKTPFSSADAEAAQASWAKFLGRQVQETNSLEQTLILIPPGEFLMGEKSVKESADEDAVSPRLDEPEPSQPAASLSAEQRSEITSVFKDLFSNAPHRVVVSRPFAVSKSEVTVGQFRKFVEATRYQTEAERNGNGGWGVNTASQQIEQSPKYSWQDPGWLQTDKSPVVNVSWNDAQEFLKWLSGREGTSYRLPTEAEWEYVCRAGTESRFFTGESSSSLAGFANLQDASFRNGLGARIANPPENLAAVSEQLEFDDQAPFTASVGSYRANPFGLADVVGNVAEWCQDTYDFTAYWGRGSERTFDPLVTEVNSTVVKSSALFADDRSVRGGSWYSSSAKAESGSRRFAPRTSPSLTIGFRVVLEVPAK